MRSAHRKIVAAVLCLCLAAVLIGCSPGTGAPDTADGAPGTASAVATSSAALTRPSSTAEEPVTSPSAPAPVSPSAAPTTTSSDGPDTDASDPGFRSSINIIGPDLAARMRTSWRADCPVGLEDLRYLTVTVRGFDGAHHDGELVVAAAVAEDVIAIFNDLYDMRYPIASLRLVDDFGGDDDASMAADNSSAFNCRPVTGGGGFSKHTYGTAIDLNPVQNPYVTGDVVLPEEGRVYVDRKPGPGVLIAGDPAVRAFEARGWTWGGTWTDPIDYQHFSVSGR